ncbi:hypothetical protein Plhal703r1_c11g0059671 [Plasmopara halstedii]
MGKGKKSKATKKSAPNSAKKVTVGQPDVQVITAIASPQDSSIATNTPLMSKSKRKRMKKAAAVESLSMNPAPSIVKSTAAATTPIKTKVAVLTPSLVAKPHVVSLTRDKKKRKLNALMGSTDALDASSASIESIKRRLIDEANTPTTIKAKKVVALSGQGGVPSISSMNAKSEALSAGSKQMNLQARHVHMKKSKQSQHSHKKESEALEAGQLMARKTVKKVAKIVSSPVVVQPKAKEKDCLIATTSLMIRQQDKSKSANNASKVAAENPEPVMHTLCVAQADSSVKESQSQNLKAEKTETNKIETILPINDKVKLCEKTNLEGGPDDSTVAHLGSFDTMPPLALCDTGMGTISFSEVSNEPTSGLLKPRPVSIAVDSPPQTVSAKVEPRQLEKGKTTFDAALLSSCGFNQSPSAKQRSSKAEILQPFEEYTECVSSGIAIQFDTEQQCAISENNFMVDPSADNECVNAAAHVASDLLMTSVLENESHAKDTQVASTVADVTLSYMKQSDRTAEDTDLTDSRNGMSQDNKEVLAKDSQTCKETAKKGERDTISDVAKNTGARLSQQMDTLPSRPPNAWGASFGLEPPIQRTPSILQRLSTTPLSSWFLSKGCANFIKHIHFSDDESTDDDNESLVRVDRTSPKRRTSNVKKNAFLETLTNHSSWRTWYGDVDVNSPLDPPLPHFPVHMDEAKVPAFSMPIVNHQETDLTRKKSKLAMLEADIRLEKLRGSAFSLQLLMALQGKSLSGNSLEEDYKMLSQR